MLNSKQRAQLRSMANTLETIVHIGKSGITDSVAAQTDTALTARELIKGKVLESSLLTAREASEELCRMCRAEPVQCIGSKFVIYRENHDIPREKRIKLVK